MRFETDEDRWRRALKETGQQEVMRQLTCYPGRPEDVLTNLPLLPPYPSRSFCQQWCLDEESRDMRPLFTLTIAFVLLALLLMCYASCTIASYVNTTTNPISGLPSQQTDPMTGLPLPPSSTPSPQSSTGLP